jgi:hypothetical protein
MVDLWAARVRYMCCDDPLELFEDEKSVPDEAKDGNVSEPFDGLH